MKINTKRFACGFAVLAITMTSIFVSCSDDEPKEAYACETCADSPQARAEFDDSNRGLYKGVVVGSTGTITVDVQNGSNAITATMVLDGETILLTSSATVTDGEIFLAPFTGMMGGNPISITFLVEPNGSTPTVVSSDIPGHPNATFEIFKETSASLVEAFEGTYVSTSGETGVFNIVLSSGLAIFGGVGKSDQTAEIENFSGEYINNNLILGNGATAATTSGDELDGSFVNEGETISVTGQRTL